MEILGTVVNKDKAFIFVHMVSFRIKYNIFEINYSNNFFYPIFISFLS